MNTYLKKLKKPLKYLAVGLAVALAGKLQAGVIGVSFIGRGGSAPAGSTLASGDAAGVVPKPNWNNVATDNQNLNNATTPALKDDSGATTAVTLNFTANDNWNSDGDPGGPDGRMMKGIIKRQGAGSAANFNFLNVPAGGYSLYVYTVVNNGGGNGDVRLNNSDGVTTYYTREYGGYTGTYLQAQNTTPAGPYDAGNYVKFYNVNRTGGGQINLTSTYVSGGDGLGIAGIQLVPLPTIASAIGRSLTSVRLVFAEPVADSSLSGTFTIAGLSVTGAALANGNTEIILTTSTQVKDTTYTVTMSGVADRVTPSYVIPANTTVSFKAVAAADIAVNFVGCCSGGTFPAPTSMNASDVAGVVPVANWNNLVTSGNNNVAANVALRDIDGNATPVTITFSADESWGSNVGVDTANKRLFNGYLGPSNGSDGGDTATVSNNQGPYRPIILRNVPDENYKVIFYTVAAGGDNMGAGFAIPGSSTTVYHTLEDNANGWNADPEFRRSQSTSPTARVRGNYVQFDNIRPVNGTLTLDCRAENFRNPLNGIQLVVDAAIAIQFTSEPVSQTVVENNTFTMSASVIGSGPRTVRWYTNGVLDTSVTSLSYSALATPSLNGVNYQVAVSNVLGNVVSSNATLTVIADVTRPTLVSVVGGPPSATKLALTFSEKMETFAAQDIFNYGILGGTPGVSSAVLQADGKTVLLTLDAPLAGGTTYTLGMTNLIDRAQVANYLNPDPTLTNISTLNLVCTNGIVQRQIFLNLSGGNVLSTLTGNGNYPNNPSSVDYPVTMNSPQSNPDIGNYGVRMYGYLTPTVSGNYQFNLHSDDSGQLSISTDANPANKVARITMDGFCCQTLESPTIYLIGGISYFIEAIMQEGGGGDYLEIKWKAPGDTGYNYIPSANLSFCIPNDTTAPTLVSASGDARPRNVVVNFSETMDDSTANAANFTVSSADGPVTVLSATLLPSFKTVVLGLASDLIPGSNYLVTASGPDVRDRSFNHNVMNPNPQSAQFTALACLQGVVLRETFLNLSGANNLGTLTGNANYPNNPSSRDYLTTFNSPQSNPNVENYGVRLIGYLIAPETANYQFQVHADDSARLRVSTDANPANLVTLINAEGDCGACGSPVSATVSLVAGVSYYVESIFQEGGGGDYLEVKWKNNASIAAFEFPNSANVAYCVNPNNVTLQITQQPVPVIQTECRSATFNVTVTTSGGGAPVYQWQSTDNTGVGFTNVPGATARTFTTPLLNEAGDNGKRLRVQVTVLGGGVVSEEVLLTVNQDRIAPTLLSVSADATFTNVILTFSEALDHDTAVDIFSDYYVITNQNGAVSVIFSATLIDGNKVLLALSDTTPLIDGQRYWITVQGVLDLCQGNPVTQVTKTFRAWTLTPCLLTFEAYGSVPDGGTIGGNDIVNLTAHPSYPTFPTARQYINSFDSRAAFPDDRHEQYGARISGFFTAPADGNYKFYMQNDDSGQLLLSTDNNPANKASIVSLPCCNGGFVDTAASADIPLLANHVYYIEGLYKEGGGGDYLKIAVRIPGDTTPTANLQPIPSPMLSTYVNLDDLVRMPTSGRLALGTLPESARGFDARIVQVATNINPINSISELLLAGLAGPNVANASCFYASVINYNIDVPGNAGHITPDAQFPGIAGTTLSSDNFAMEALAYVELPAGIVAMGVNSDDGFRVSPATGVTDPNNSIVLGEFDGGRGSSDSVFLIDVPQAGLYPMRLTWVQGGGGASVEWWTVDCFNGYRAINANPGFKAYRQSVRNVPSLSIVRSGGTATITWAPTPVCWKLQGTPELKNPSSSTVWTDIPGNSGVMVPDDSGNQFFRLVRP